MKDVFIILVSNLVSLTFIITAWHLLLNDKGGWGWFLFGAIVTFVYFTNNSKEE